LKRICSRGFRQTANEGLQIAAKAGNRSGLWEDWKILMLPSRSWFYIGGAVLLVIGLMVAVAGYIHFRAYSPDRSDYPLRGIDVSHHQKDIDWQRVAADDVSFAIIKATEGGDWVDRLFARNLREARAAGLAVGAYHFYRFCRPPADQAKNFIDTVPRDRPLLPPVVDIEFVGNCERRPTVDEMRAELAEFLRPVEAAFGKPAIIYLIDEAEQMYGAAMPVRRRWVRAIKRHPGHENWTYWQFHNRGRVDGIAGDVDLNVLQGGEAILRELVGE
jgi:lysozyme